MNRRRHPRVPYGAWIENLTKEGTIQFFLAKNLSIGGLLLAAEVPPDVGHRLHLRLVVENETKVVSVEGTVVRHSPQPDGMTSFAVVFDKLDDTRQSFLQELVDELAKTEREDPTPNVR